jgi:hypothetical protein
VEILWTNGAKAVEKLRAKKKFRVRDASARRLAMRCGHGLRVALRLIALA